MAYDYPNHISQTNTTPEGIPLPPGNLSIDLLLAVSNLKHPEARAAFEINEGIGSAHPFYLCEVIAQEWTIDEYMPCHNGQSLGFARFRLVRAEHVAGVGLLL